MRRSVSMTLIQQSKNATSKLPRAETLAPKREREANPASSSMRNVDSMGDASPSPTKNQATMRSLSPRLRFFPPLPLFFGMDAVCGAPALLGRDEREERKRERERGSLLRRKGRSKRVLCVCDAAAFFFSFFFVVFFFTPVLQPLSLSLSLSALQSFPPP